MLVKLIPSDSSKRFTCVQTSIVCWVLYIVYIKYLLLMYFDWYLCTLVYERSILGRNLVETCG